MIMNLESLPRSETTIHVTAPAAAISRGGPTSSQTMPQRSPFAIQELLGLSNESRQSGAVSAVTPSLYPSQTHFTADHHQMMSRMAYFNAHAAVAAFLPHHNHGPLGLHHHHQTSGNFDDCVHSWWVEKRDLYLRCSGWALAGGCSHIQQVVN